MFFSSQFNLSVRDFIKCFQCPNLWREFQRTFSSQFNPLSIFYFFTHFFVTSFKYLLNPKYPLLKSMIFKSLTSITNPNLKYPLLWFCHPWSCDSATINLALNWCSSKRNSHWVKERSNLIKQQVSIFFGPLLSSTCTQRWITTTHTVPIR